jgi:hypothetical protein
MMFSFTGLYWTLLPPCIFTLSKSHRLYQHFNYHQKHDVRLRHMPKSAGPVMP